MLTHHLLDRKLFGQNTWFGKLDPRLKIIFILLALAINLGRNSFPTCGFFTLLAIFFFILARVSLKALVIRLIPPAGVAAIVVLMQAVLVRGTPLLVLSLPSVSLRIAVSHQGLIQGGLRACLILSGTLLILLLVLTTPEHRMVSSMAWFRMPALFVDLFLFISRYLFLLAEETDRIFEAQRVRLGYSGWRQSLRSLQTLGGMLILRAFDRAENVYQAMQSRGYDGQKVTIVPDPLTRRDYLSLFILLGLNLVGLVI